MPMRPLTRCALMTGAKRGIVYGAAKLLIKREKNMEVFLTTKGGNWGRKEVLRSQIGADERRATFINMDVTKQDSIFKVRDEILKKYKGLDILVNNAVVHHVPDLSPDVYPGQVQDTMAVNYWGLKSVVQTFLPHLNPHARMVNMTSNLGDINNIVGDFPGANQLRKKFSSYLDEEELDGLVKKFESDVNKGHRVWREAGWPACPYTVSKIAVNAYTRILQQKLDSEELNRNPDLVVNAVYAGTGNSSDSAVRGFSEDLVDNEEGARNLVHMTQIVRNSYGIFPRGAVVWNNLRVVEDMEDYPTAVRSKKPQYGNL